MGLRNILNTPVGEIGHAAYALGQKTASRASERLSPHLTRRKVLIVGTGLAGAAALGVSGIRLYRSLKHPRNNNNVILIVSDAMRADKLGKTIAGREVTPHLNRLARDAVHFENAYAASTSTKVSVPSILSGQYPQYHGVLAPNLTLPDIPTIPSFFLDLRYAVVGIVSNPVIREESGRVRHGFGYPFKKRDFTDGQGLWGGYVRLRLNDHEIFYRDKRFEMGTKDTSRLFSVLWKVVEGHPRILEGRPFFAYVHDMRTHQPWISAGPMHGITGIFHNAPISEEEAWQADYEAVTRVLTKTSYKDVSDEDKRTLASINDEAAAAFDMRFGEFVQRLKREGIYRNATIIVTADHGDELWEHGTLGHSQNLYNVSLKVPLIFRHPGIAPRRITARVSNASIFPTLMDLFAGKPLENSTLCSLKPYMTGEIPPDKELVPIVAQLRRDKAKIILPSGIEAIRDGNEYEFYDINRDGGENAQLEECSQAKDALERELSAAGSFAAADGVSAPVTNIPAMSFWVRIDEDGKFEAKDEGEIENVPDAVKRQLRALGYLN